MTARPVADPNDPLLAAAELLATQDPRFWHRLVTDHVADHGGHCRGCRPSSGASPVWPCRLAVIAAEAGRMVAAARRST